MKSVLFASIVAIILASGGALECYHTVGIDKPFSTSDPTIECSNDRDTCIKALSSSTNGSNIVLRTCTENFKCLFDFDNISDYFSVNTIEEAFDSVHYCRVDNCNGAQLIIAVFSVIVSSFLISIFC